MLVLHTPDKRISSHVALRKSVYETLTCHSNLYTMQFFLGNPRTWNCRVIDQPEKDKIFDMCQREDKTFYVHANYPVLLGYPNNSDRQLKASKFVNSVLGSLNGIPGGLICHIAKGKDSSIENVISFVNSINVPKPTGRIKSSLILENAAGQGYERGVTFPELKQIFDNVDNGVGLCIDTQHSFAGGLCNFSDPKQIEKFFTDLDQHLPNRLSVIHLNDSDVPFGSRKDRHGGSGLCGGHIWGRDDSGLKCLLKIAYRRELDLILETGRCAFDREILFNYYYDL